MGNLDGVRYVGKVRAEMLPKYQSGQTGIMRTIVLLGLVIFAFAAEAFAGEIGDLPWNKSNIATLRGLDEAAVDKFVNEESEGDVHKTVGEFTWADLAGDGEYELITTFDLSGRSFFDYLAVYERDDAGKISVQWFSEETAIGRLSSVIRDLDDDGRKELIIPTLYPSGAYGAGFGERSVAGCLQTEEWDLRRGKQ